MKSGNTFKHAWFWIWCIWLPCSLNHIPPRQQKSPVTTWVAALYLHPAVRGHCRYSPCWLYTWLGSRTGWFYRGTERGFRKWKPMGTTKCWGPGRWVVTSVVCDCHKQKEAWQSQGSSRAVKKLWVVGSHHQELNERSGWRCSEEYKEIKKKRPKDEFSILVRNKDSLRGPLHSLGYPVWNQVPGYICFSDETQQVPL